LRNSQGDQLHKRGPEQMADPLSEAENICLRILAAPGKFGGFPSDAKEDIERRLQDVATIVAKSKKKIMVRSPEGQKLSADILRDATALQAVVANLSANGRDTNVAEVNASLQKLENGAKKLEIYWKSFEYATT